MGKRKERSCKTPQHAAGMSKSACLCAGRVRMCVVKKYLMWDPHQLVHQLLRPGLYSHVVMFTFLHVTHTFLEVHMEWKKEGGREREKSGHKELTKTWQEKKIVSWGDGRKNLNSERGGKMEGGPVREVRIRGEQCCLIFTCFSFPLSLFQLMCVFQCQYTDRLPCANTEPSLWIGNTDSRS